MGARSSQPRSPHLNKTDGHLLEYFRDAFGAGGGGTTAQPVSGIVASGGVATDYTIGTDIYRAHVFLSTGTLVVDSLGSGAIPANIDYLVVGGGGGGGGKSAQSGGGGAGGFRTNLPGHPVKAADYVIEEGTYTVIVGAGGASPNADGEIAAKGGDSDFHPAPVSWPSTKFVRAHGGGGGCGYSIAPGPGMNGGSGGGAPNNTGHGAGGTGNTADPNHPQRQGYNGGDDDPYYNTPASPYAGGGGGGAGRLGAPDAPDTPLTKSTGGFGLQALIAGPPAQPQPVGASGPGSGAAATGYFAGGGGGGGYSDTGAAGGYGGGGDGAPFSGTSQPSVGASGVMSSGGGGGGGGHPAYAPGGNGGSGVVVVRYKIGSIDTSAAKATGGMVSFYNGKTVHVFTSTGSLSSDSPFNETCECVIIGGGAGTGNPATSGAHGSGGGGAGAVYDRNNVALNLSGPWSFNVQVGGGGAKKAYERGGNGTPSFAAFPTGTLTAPGGGAGGVSVSGSEPGNAGGAGGGASNYSGSDPFPGGDGDGAPWPGTPGNDPGSGWGGNGGTSVVASGSYGGGGGGGAVNGQNGSGTQGGDGGGGYKIPASYQSPDIEIGYPGPGSTYFWFAGGGGGGVYNNASGPEGIGGGGPDLSTPYAGAGNGTYRTGPVSGRGKVNSGSGAGGGGGGNAAYGNVGGSGIVLIAYPT